MPEKSKHQKILDEIIRKSKAKWCKAVQSKAGQEILSELKQLEEDADGLAKRLEILVKKGEAEETIGLTFKTLLAAMSAERAKMEIKEILDWAERCKPKETGEISD